MRDSKTIVIAEDDPDVLLFLRDRLESLGFQVAAVTNGREAVEVIVHGHYSIALLDIMMAEMDGIEALRVIRKMQPSMPVIMISASAEKAAASLAAGAQGYLLKPIDPALLATAVERWRLV